MICFFLFSHYVLSHHPTGVVGEDVFNIVAALICTHVIARYALLHEISIDTLSRRYSITYGYDPIILYTAHQQLVEPVRIFILATSNKERTCYIAVLRSNCNSWMKLNLAYTLSIDTLSLAYSQSLDTINAFAQTLAEKMQIEFEPDVKRFGS